MIDARIATAIGINVMLTSPESDADIKESAVMWMPWAEYIKSPIAESISHWRAFPFRRADRPVT